MYAALRLTARTISHGRGLAFAAGLVGALRTVMLAYRFFWSEPLDALPVDAIAINSAADIPLLGPAGDFGFTHRRRQRVRSAELRGRDVLIVSEAG